MDASSTPAGPDRRTESERLRQEIANALAAGLRVVALIDPASFPDAWRRFQAMATACGGGSLFDGTAQPQHPSVAPLVLPLESADGTELPALVQAAMTSPAVIWLASPLTPADLMPRLALKLDAELADSHRRLTLRYYDPRALEQLLQTLDTDQQQHLNDGVASWWWLDRRNLLRRHDPVTATEKPTPAPEIGRAPIALRDEQVDALLAGSFADRVLHLLLNHSPTALQGLDRAQRQAWATALIAEASAWNLSAEYDCALFLAEALQHGPLYAHQHPWNDTMRKVQSGTLKFSEAVDEWSRKDANGH